MRGVVPRRALYAGSARAAGRGPGGARRRAGEPGPWRRAGSGTRPRMGRMV
ncbi:EamA family transporter, partial [Burkholderia multivorans]